MSRPRERRILPLCVASPRGGWLTPIENNDMTIICDGSDRKFGYYSVLAHQAYRNGGHNISPSLWRNPAGEDVYITCVGPTRDPSYCGYMWPDAECVGEVVSYIGRPLVEDGHDPRNAFSWKGGR